MRKEYSSRGYLVIEYVKIGDPNIIDKRFKTESEYEDNLLKVITRGFNLVYGNVFTRSFKYYRYENRGERTMSEPLQLKEGFIYGMSNGELD